MDIKYVIQNIHKSRKGQTGQRFDVGDYTIQLRRSLPLHRIVDPFTGRIQKVETLDVVTISYRKFNQMRCNIEEVPKDGAKFIWDALDEYCKEHGVALRIECIMSEKWFNHLLEKKGFVKQYSHPTPLDFKFPFHDTFSANVIKTYETTRITEDESTD